MSTQTLSKESLRAIEFFEDKLSFEISAYALNILLNEKQPVQIVDIRDPKSYAAGHIPGAINLQLDELNQPNVKLNPGQAVVVYCYNLTCALAAKGALALAKKGFSVKELVGGFEDWASQHAGETYKVEKAGSSCGTSSCG
jgi:rhodanese-related sulfurtransferase